MKYLELTFADPASNLACDEALLDYCESEGIADGLLRLWQPETYFVVLGHSNRVQAEVDLPACAAADIAVLRRISGGGAVLQGPGCINYSLVLDARAHDIKNIQAGFRYVLERHRQWAQDLTGAKIRIEGISDLTLGGRKFSGNAQYRRAAYVLVHGTFLVQFEVSMMERSLRLPNKQPAYRSHRGHSEFVTNLGLDADKITSGLQSIWRASEPLETVPAGRIEHLVNTRYGREEWSRKF